MSKERLHGPVSAGRVSVVELTLSPAPASPDPSSFVLPPLRSPGARPGAVDFHVHRPHDFPFRGSSGFRSTPGRLLLALAGVGCAVVSGCARETAAAKANEPPPVVVATPVKMPIVEWDEYIGRLDAIETVEVRSRVSGYLASSHFEEGQLVKEGDLLAVIDQRPF